MPNTIDMVVEIPRGSRSKYEFDAAMGRLRLDRVLDASVKGWRDAQAAWAAINEAKQSYFERHSRSNLATSRAG